MLTRLKAQVLRANQMIAATGLAILTWGNVSGYDPESGLVVIKGSGIPYADMTEADLAVVELESGRVLGDIVPSTDLDTHLVLYRNFKNIRGIIHTHSCFATSWAQSERSIPCLGTTHADYFMGSIPCTREMTTEEVNGHYELNTGTVIVEAMRNYDPKTMSAALVRRHGPFVWGNSPIDAFEKALILENIAKMALITELLTGNENMTELNSIISARHYNRKFGKEAYYGQKKKG